MKKTNVKILIGAFLGIALFLTIAFLLFSGPRMKDQPSLRAFEERVNLPPQQSVFYKADEFSVSEVSLPEANKTNLNKGQVYYEYYCKFCHGADGKGSGPVGESYVPRPADLTNDSLNYLEPLKLYELSFTGTGHHPVLERVIPNEHRNFIILYIKEQF